MFINFAYRATPSMLKRRVKDFILKHELGDYAFRFSIGALQRPHYAHILMNAAKLAHHLGYSTISAIEFGVAGGRGLISLEYHASKIETIIPVKFELYGFDTGKGLPDPQDYRDLPYHWKGGFFHMNERELRKQLTRTKLILGDIRTTSTSFFTHHNPAPIGAVIHDFDFYSSTAEALRLFNAPERNFLPRIFCYFDDIIGDEISLYNDFTGERLAINEFNSKGEYIKLSPAYYLLRLPRETWHYKIFICHVFRHTKYCDFVSVEDQQLLISESRRIR